MHKQVALHLVVFIRSLHHNGSTTNTTGAIDVTMDGSVLEEKSSFKMLGLTFSSKLDWGSYIVSIAKTTSKKIGALIHSCFFLLRMFCIYKSIIQPCIEYCCQVWAGAPSCYLELLDKLLLLICRTWLFPSLQLLPLLNPWLISKYSQIKACVCYFL